MAFTATQGLEFLRNSDKLNGSSRAQALYYKMLNDSQREMFSLGTADFTQRSTRLSLAVPYTTGTVSVSAGGTAVTGSGTTFTSAMVGRFIRFAGEAEQYEITAFSSTTAITIETYLGTVAQSGATYVISEDRKSLPTLFRSVHQVVLTNATGGSGAVYNLEPRSFEQVNHMRKSYVTAVYPYFFCTKWVTPASGNVPVGYLYLYPSPSVAQIVTVYYNTWPANLTTGTDECSIPYELEGAYREFLLAFLYRENRDPNWMAQLDRARKVALDTIAATRTNTATRTRSEWQPPYECDFYRQPVIDPSVLSQLDP